jgi:dihydrofolate synthase/folylpolyglutamate synthase
VTGSTPDALLTRLEGLGIRLGLDTLRRLLAALGDPQHRFPSVLVAGTNGKGSTSALLAAMAGAAGYRTGLYTSPHLEAVTERIRLDGHAIAPERLAAHLEKVIATSQALSEGDLPTYFEAMTAAAFLDFAAAGVDLAIVEVGLGGRLDATNVADPVLSVITQIDLDHADQLGPTTTHIAREKAGILRPNRPAVAWVEDPAAAAELRRVAGELGSALHDATQEVRIDGAVPDPDSAGQRVALTTPRGSYDLTLTLPGDHQAANLALAVRAAELLATAGFPRIDPAAIATGAANCRWPGRLERIVLPEGHAMLLDAAHNPAGSAVLAEYLEILKESKGVTVDLVFGVLSDKDAAAMLGRLAPCARRLILTTPASPRAVPPEDLARSLASEHPELAARLLIEPEPGRALERGLDLGADLLVVCGSIYLIGEVRQILRKRFGVPPPADGIATG